MWRERDTNEVVALLWFPDGNSENTATKIEFSSPLEIVLYPEPVLREKCKTIAVFDESLESLAKEMFDVMYR